MKRFVLFSLSAFFLLGARPAAGAAEPAPAFPLEAYTALGSDFALKTRLSELGLDAPQVNAFVEGMRAAMQGRPRPLDAKSQALYEAIALRLQSLVDRDAPAAAPDSFSTPGRLEAYLKEMAKKFNLQRSDTGLAYTLVSNGTTIRPAPEDTVVISYKVVAPDAQTELTALEVKEQQLKVSGLIPGLAEAVQMMTPGATAMLIVPPDLSYGAGAWPADVPPGVPLIFTVKLHHIVMTP